MLSPETLGRWTGNLVCFGILIVLFQRWFSYKTKRRQLNKLTEIDFPDIDKYKFGIWKKAQMRFYKIYNYYMSILIYLILIMILLGFIAGFFHLRIGNIFNIIGLLWGIFFMVGFIIVLFFRIKAHILENKAGIDWQ